MRNSKNFTDNLENRIDVFSLLPEKTRLSLVRESSEYWDFPWLEAIMASGWLNPDKLISASDKNFEEIHTEWFKKTAALSFFSIQKTARGLLPSALAA